LHGGAGLWGFGGLLVHLFRAVFGPVGDLAVGGGFGVVQADDVVGVVALGGGVAGVADEFAEDGFVEAVGCAGGGDDVFFHHDAAHVVGTVGEGDLADVGAHGDP